MKITLLCENSASDMCWLAEWGFSAYVEAAGVNILFDTGYSDVYKRNAKRAWIDLNDTDFVVLSHYHDDHSRGLQFHEFTKRKKIVLHPRILQTLPGGEVLNIKNDFEVMETSAPLEFANDVFFLGEIPRIMPFEKGGAGKDPMPDDTAIAIKTAKGAVVITGCSHAGICNICEYAKKITGQSLYAVLGGFHLLGNKENVTEQTIAYFQQEKPEKLFPMHCVDFPNMVKFHTHFGCPKYAAGDTIEL